jgi:hypothetical protein
MAMGNAGARPLAARAAPSRQAPMRAGHVGRGPCFVDEDKALRIEVELALEPILSPLQDVGPILLACMGGLFLRVSL